MRLIKKSPIKNVIFLMCIMSFNVSANDPYLLFSDLISGPSTGLGDGIGSGVVVTVWAQNADVEGSGNQISFRDSRNNLHTPVVYYWKTANGVLPSGPSNLFESHKMSEIAFSIPEAAPGLGRIFIKSDTAESNSLPFLVREGSIYHIKSSGSTDNSGTWSKPWSDPTTAINKAEAGSTIYLHDVNAGSFSSPASRALYWNNAKAASSLNAQFAIIAYPGFQPKVIAQKAVESYRTSGMVVSKMDIYASNYLEVDELGQPRGSVIESSPGDTYGVKTTKSGRVIGNRIGDIPGGCASKWNGAINGNRDHVEGARIFGNEVYDYGCNGSSKLHHTTYLSIRSGTGMVVDAWEWGYNYLHGNKAKFGIHNYDEGNACGDINGALRIHNNVIVDQAGAGISVGSNCGWSMDAVIENNILINVGLAADWDGVNVDTSNGAENGGIALRDSGERGLTGNFYIRNNLIYGHSEDGQQNGGRGCLNLNGDGDSIAIFWDNNVCIGGYSLPLVSASNRAAKKLDNIIGADNFWRYFSKNVAASEFPIWAQSSISEGSGMIVNDSQVRLVPNSSLLSVVEDRDKNMAGTAKLLSTGMDIYGVARPKPGAVGPVEFAISPVAPLNPPEELFVE
jgi:hypothetical protein